MSEQSNLNVVQTMFAAFQRGDVPTMTELCAEDVSWRMNGPAAIPFAGHRTGRQGVAEFFRAVGESMETLENEVLDMVASDAKVVAQGRERIRVRSTGRMADNEWVMVFTLRDGLVADFRTYEDTAALQAAFTADE